jgi:AbrB family looped-hinge helix DNA binding protein
MAIAHSKVTSQGQISVPAEVRRKLGIGPGSILEWDEQGDDVLVRRAGGYSSADMHQALFPQGTPMTRSITEMKEGVRRHIRKRYARR